jgi:hypothetical protein
MVRVQITQTYLGLILILHACVTCSGVFIKWLSLECLCLSPEGVLVITSMDGAVCASSEPVGTVRSDPSQSEESPRETSAYMDIIDRLDKHSNKKSKHSTSSSATNLHKNLNNLKGQIPASYTDTVAPEIIFGSAPTPSSCAYTAACLCAYLLAGKVPIKVTRLHQTLCVL